METKPFLTEREAAALLGVTVQTLYRWRTGKNYRYEVGADGNRQRVATKPVVAGVPVLRIGRKVRYDRDALIAWVKGQTEGACHGSDS